MLVKDNKVLAAARKRIRHVIGNVPKNEIKAILKEGKTCTCTPEQVKELRIWCGLSKPKAPVKRATVKPKAAPAKKKVAENNQQKKHGGKRPNSGGARKGSGRKVGAATVKTRAIADKLVEDGELTPLEYTLSVMRETPEKLKAQHEKGDIDVVEYTIKMQELIRRKDKAAETAMSFIHPRLSSIDASVGLTGHDAFIALMAEAAEK